MNKQSIAEMMKTKQETARKNIEREAWKNKPDTSKIADAAISGGLTPEDAEKISSEIEAQKKQIAELHSIDIQALKQAQDKTAQEAAQTASTLEKAQQAHDKALANSEDATAEFERAFQKLREAANRSTPELADKCPDIIRRIQAYDSAVNHAQRLHSEMQQDRLVKTQLEDAIKHDEKALAEAARSRKQGEGRVDVGAGALHDISRGAEARLKKAKKQLAAVTKRLKDAPAEKAKREKAQADAKAAIFLEE